MEVYRPGEVFSVAIRNPSGMGAKVARCAGSFVLPCFLFLWISDAANPATASIPYKYCSSYCTESGTLANGQYCRKPEAPYCCGDKTYKYCCNDTSLVIDVPDVTSCTGATQTTQSWVIIVVVISLAGLFFIISLVGCVCVCHQRCRWRHAFHFGVSPRSIDGFSPGGERSPSSVVDFDPTSPNAFAPPPYDSLSKTPPSYCEVFTISGNCSETTCSACSSQPPTPSDAYDNSDWTRPPSVLPDICDWSRPPSFRDSEQHSRQPRPRSLPSAGDSIELHSRHPWTTETGNAVPPQPPPPLPPLPPPPLPLLSFPPQSTNDVLPTTFGV